MIEAYKTNSLQKLGKFLRLKYSHNMNIPLQVLATQKGVCKIDIFLQNLHFEINPLEGLLDRLWLLQGVSGQNFNFSSKFTF